MVLCYLNIFIVNLTSFLFFISFHIILYIHVYNNAVKLQCTKIIYILENRIHMHLRIKILNINDAKKNNNKIFIFVVNLQIQFIINKINFVVINEISFCF